MFAIDGYKTFHKSIYPPNCNLIYSNLTARSAKHKNIPDSMWTNKTVFFGLQYFVQKFLIEDFQNNFFSRKKEDVVTEYARLMDSYLGPGIVTTEHVAELHDLGYLPIEIRAVFEGELVDIGIPMLTIHNTNPIDDNLFYWLTNYLETVLSAYLWPMITSATTAYHYKKFLTEAAYRTGANLDFVNWQGHDFSARGMFGLEAMMMSGAGHLTSFTGTDTIPAIILLEQYYQATGLIGGSVRASEHSCCSSYGREDELNGYYRRILTEVCPDGIVSLVSDTYDYWKVLTEYLPQLKNEIMNRNGKCVIRPDTGTPELIVCGDPNAPEGSPERKGSIQILWEIFGGTINGKGYKTLDSHIGLIYGDSITPERCQTIINRLAEMGFASDNIVLGIGSFSYQLVTRDSLGMAVKATYCEINNEPRLIFKDPKTSDGNMNKKSLRGCVVVNHDPAGNLVVQDGLTLGEATALGGLLEPVFRNGVLLRTTSLSEIRQRLSDSMKVVTPNS